MSETLVTLFMILIGQFYGKVLAELEYIYLVLIEVMLIQTEKKNLKCCVPLQMSLDSQKRF